jgi:hypothetical protein
LITAKFILCKTAKCSCKQIHMYNAVCQYVIIYTCIRVYIFILKRVEQNSNLHQGQKCSSHWAVETIKHLSSNHFNYNGSQTSHCLHCLNHYPRYIQFLRWCFLYNKNSFSLLEQLTASKNWTSFCAQWKEGKDTCIAEQCNQHSFLSTKRDCGKGQRGDSEKQIKEL